MANTTNLYYNSNMARCQEGAFGRTRSRRFSGTLQSRQFKIVAVDSTSAHPVEYEGKKAAYVVPR